MPLSRVFWFLVPWRWYKGDAFLSLALSTWTENSSLFIGRISQLNFLSSLISSSSSSSYSNFFTFVIYVLLLPLVRVNEVCVCMMYYCIYGNFVFIVIEQLRESSTGRPEFCCFGLRLIDSVKLVGLRLSTVTKIRSSLSEYLYNEFLYFSLDGP